jgi:hypothetical protein
MTRAGRRLVVLGVVLATSAGLSGCKVLRRADPSPDDSTTAAANALAGSPASGDASSCPIDADAISAVLGGRWQVSSLPSGGCNYTHEGRSILISTVPLPKDAAGQQAALARARKPCDAGSAKLLRGDAFVCRQDTLLEAAAISGHRLLVVCTAAGTDPTKVPGIRAQLGTLVSAVATN